MHTKRFDLQKRKPSIVVSFSLSVCSPEKDEMSLTECVRVRAKRQKEWSHRESNTGRSRIFAGLIRSDGPQATVIPLHYRTDGRFDYPCNILYSILHALLLSRHRVLELNKSITVPSTSFPPYIDTPYLIQPCLAHPPQQHCESHSATEYRTSVARSQPVSLVASSRCQAACSHLRRSTICTNSKIKVKCDIKTTDAPCTRCRTRGLSCTVNKSLQMLLEDDASYVVFSPVLVPF
jgi:hypothetical protein